MSQPIELGPRDLIRALALRERHARSEEPLAGYWRRRAALLGGALGLPADWENAAQTPAMLTALARESVREDMSAGYLEYAWRPGEQELVAATRPAIDKAAAVLRRRHEELALKLLLLGWPQLRRRRTTLSALIAQGLPEHEPEPLDYL